MKGSSTVEFLLSFIVLFSFVSVLAGGFLKKPYHKQDGNSAIAVSSANRCFSFYTVDVGKVLCIENSCNGEGLAGGDSCEKRSFLD